MNKLACVEEHQQCFRYEGSKYPLIEFLNYPIESVWEETLQQSEIIIVYEGSFIISYDHFLNHKISSGEMVLLPPGCQYKASTEEGVSLCIFRLKNMVRLCVNFNLHKTENNQRSKLSNQLNILKVKDPVKNLLPSLKTNMENGLKCGIYLQNKIDELLILLRTYYDKSIIRDFMNPLISNTSEFTHFVLQNYRKVKTVKELADLYSRSISCFDKKFRKAFGKAPYKWMQERKIAQIQHEILTTNKPIKQIAEEQQFASLPQFNDYCKKHFGYPPGRMRKMTYL